MPAVPDDVLSGPSRLRELRCEAMNPPVDAYVVDLDAALRQEFLDVPVGEAEPQVPADRQGDDLGWEPVPGEGRARCRMRTRVSVRSHEHESPRLAA
jgi:hypothetical protein